MTEQYISVVETYGIVAGIIVETDDSVAGIIVVDTDGIVAGSIVETDDIVSGIRVEAE